MPGVKVDHGTRKLASCLFQQEGALYALKECFYIGYTIKINDGDICCVQHQQKGNKMGDEKDKRDRDLNLSVSLSLTFMSNTFFEQKKHSIRMGWQIYEARLA